jgi:hypothetical protein
MSTGIRVSRNDPEGTVEVTAYYELEGRTNGRKGRVED